jgi:hypothetical protein
MKQPGIDAENAKELVRAFDAVAGTLPFPAADTGDALRAYELPGGVAARRILAAGLLGCGFELPPFLGDLAVRVLEIAREPFETTAPSAPAGRLPSRLRPETKQHRVQIRQRVRQPAGQYADP